MNKANKSDVILKLASKCGIKKEEAERRVNAVLESLVEVLEDVSQGEPEGKDRTVGKLTLVGFGVYEVVHIPQRTYRNPQDPQNPVQKESHNDVRFDPGTALYNSVQ